MLNKVIKKWDLWIQAEQISLKIAELEEDDEDKKDAEEDIANYTEKKAEAEANLKSDEGDAEDPKITAIKDKIKEKSKEYYEENKEKHLKAQQECRKCRSCKLFQTEKINENVMKFYRIDKNSKIVSDEKISPFIVGRNVDACCFGLLSFHFYSHYFS